MFFERIVFLGKNLNVECSNVGDVEKDFCLTQTNDDIIIALRESSIFKSIICFENVFILQNAPQIMDFRRYGSHVFCFFQHIFRMFEIFFTFHENDKFDSSSPL